MLHLFNACYYSPLKVLSYRISQPENKFPFLALTGHLCSGWAITKLIYGIDLKFH